MQGSGRALRVRHGARNLTDGGGLVLVRALFDRFALAGRIDCGTKGERGFFRPGLMTEVWIVLLLYGGGVMTGLRLPDRRGIRRIFGWVRVPHPTTFGRWLRSSGEAMVPLLDAVLRGMVRQRWAMAGGAPKKVTVMMDSTVAVRYGRKQAGAERVEELVQLSAGQDGGRRPRTATRCCGASPSWPTRRCTRFANNASPAPGGRRSQGGSASGCSGFRRS